MSKKNATFGKIIINRHGGSITVTPDGGKPVALSLEHGEAIAIALYHEGHQDEAGITIKRSVEGAGEPWSVTSTGVGVYVATYSDEDTVTATWDLGDDYQGRQLVMSIGEAWRPSQGPGPVLDREAFDNAIRAMTAHDSLASLVRLQQVDEAVGALSFRASDPGQAALAEALHARGVMVTVH